MAYIPKISSFQEVAIDTRKTLVICDIDDTVLTWEHSLEYYMTIAERDLSGSHVAVINYYAKNMMYLHRKSFLPQATDLLGFRSMLEKLSANPTSDFLFLTARTGHASAIQQTTRELEGIGISSKHKIYFTGNDLPKGKYIVDHIDYRGYDKVIFIDDLEGNISSVSMYCPTIVCYQFVCK
jgi:hypothetical protein